MEIEQHVAHAPDRAKDRISRVVEVRQVWVRLREQFESHLEDNHLLDWIVVDVVRDPASLLLGCLDHVREEQPPLLVDFFQTLDGLPELLGAFGCLHLELQIVCAQAPLEPLDRFELDFSVNGTRI